MIDDRRIEDGAVVHPEPVESAQKIRDHLCIHGEGIETEVEGSEWSGCGDRFGYRPRGQGNATHLT